MEVHDTQEPGKAIELAADRLYAGIGSRETPVEVLIFMSRLAGRLALNGYCLRSGAAPGADKAFEDGCTAFGGAAEIWLPWKGFQEHADTGLYPSKQHFELATTIHPAWDKLSRGAKALMARNTGQILGKDLQTPVEFVVCWTPDGCDSEEKRSAKTGGTGAAIALACRHSIPVYNLRAPGAREKLFKHVQARLSSSCSTPA